MHTQSYLFLPLLIFCTNYWCDFICSVKNDFYLATIYIWCNITFHSSKLNCVWNKTICFLRMFNGPNNYVEFIFTTHSNSYHSDQNLCPCNGMSFIILVIFFTFSYFHLIFLALDKTVQSPGSFNPMASWTRWPFSMCKKWHLSSPDNCGRSE